MSLAGAQAFKQNRRKSEKTANARGGGRLIMWESCLISKLINEGVEVSWRSARR